MGKFHPCLYTKVTEFIQTLTLWRVDMALTTVTTLPL